MNPEEVLNNQEKASERIISREEVFDMLQKGHEDPKARDLAIEWTKQEEKNVTNSHGSIILNAKRAGLYVMAGKDPRPALEDARYQAVQEGETGLQDEIDGQLAQLAA